MIAKSSNTTQNFLFRIPTVSEELTIGARAAIQIGALASQQVETTRTRCLHPDGRDENVAEHSLMLAKVAPELATLLYPELDANLVARFATLHDDVEIYVGDTPTDMLSDLDPVAKEQRELSGLNKIEKEYVHIPGYVTLMQQYEKQSVPEARFVRAVDKLMVLLIHFPNSGAILRANYSHEDYLQSERDLLVRDAHKYGEFDKIIKLRQELGQELAEKFLQKP